jgi:hypothetical protein
MADDLKKHVKACPIGWHQGQLRMHRATTDADVIAWILELERLAGVAPEMIKTRLPRPIDR